MPRVTEVIGVLNLYEGVPAHRLEFAADRGTHLHRVCLGWVSGRPYPCAPEYQGRFHAFKEWFAANIVEVMAVELPLDDKKMEIRTEGVDLIARFKGDRTFSVLDLKTMSAWTSLTHRAVELQLAAYHYMAEYNLRRHFGRREAVWLQEDRVKVIPCNSMGSLVAFRSALNLYNFINNAPRKE